MPMESYWNFNPNKDIIHVMKFEFGADQSCSFILKILCPKNLISFKNSLDFSDTVVISTASENLVNVCEKESC